ncbi:MAG: TRAFs-binding domain-containing protein, partial [Anaerolineales bacterium]
MALKKLFGKQETVTAGATSAISEQSAEQREKEAKQIVEKTKEMAEKIEKIADPSTVVEKRKLRPEIRPHAFVVMPFGKKKGGDGSLYDFNAIYQTLIKPALEAAGFEPFRADESTSSGDILTDMFQELLLADLVLADLSIDNANAFYELGIRHAFRKRGIVHIQAGRAYMPFDIFNVRTLPYHITPEGIPDPEFLDKDIQSIARITRDTWASDRDAIHSPIFNLLTGLDEPDQKALRTPLATGFWREYKEWKERVAIARRQKRIGDILLLTEEISHPLIKEEAIGQAGKALANMGRNELALAQYRKGLEINPRNLSFRRAEAFHLNRLDRVDEAIVKVEAILADYPGDSEANAYLGRIYKEMWTDSWQWVTDPEKRLRTAFESYHWLIKSYQVYVRGFKADLDQFYPGINALTLGTILVYLADKFDDKEDPDPDITAIREDLPELRGTLEFALETQAANPNADYWTLVSLADLHVLTADRIQRVVRAYRKAMTASRRNIFFLESSIQQLEMLKSLEIRSEYVAAGIKILKEELARIHKEEYAEDEDEEVIEHKHEGGNVFLFTGYMIDKTKEQEMHFPAHIEEDVKKAIGDLLDQYQAGPKDLAITGGMAAGGDLIFIECCAQRGIPVKAHLPFNEAIYVRDFVSPGGEDWVERFYNARNHPLVDEFYQHEFVGDPRDGDDPCERNNRWALYSSFSHGIDKVRLIALWNDKNRHQTYKDARLVEHMVELMRDVGGQVEII